MVISNIFYFHPYLGKTPILTNIVQMGWNHQPGGIGGQRCFVCFLNGSLCWRESSIGWTWDFVELHGEKGMEWAHQWMLGPTNRVFKKTCTKILFSLDYILPFFLQYIWMFPKNNGTPKSSTLIGFSIKNTIHFGVPLFLETPIYIYTYIHT